MRSLTVRRDQAILKEINWRVLPGERWVILGANGSGKTSLISSVAGYLPPTSGEIRVLGETFGHSDWRELRKRIGIVSPYVEDRVGPSTSALDIVLTGRAATMALYDHADPLARREAASLLKTMGCGRLGNRPWSTLSQGEKKRVLIARAFMAQYELLFLDEPCASLDPVARERFLSMLRRIGKVRKGPSIVLVTHHVEEIGPEFTHVLMLKKGAVIGAGRIDGIISTEQLSLAYGARVQLLEDAIYRYALRVRNT